MQDERELRWKVCKHNCKKERLSLNCYGVIGTFTNGILRIINNDKDFINEDAIVEKVKKVNDDIVQAIKNKEANEATDESAKDNHMTGA